MGAVGSYNQCTQAKRAGSRKGAASARAHRYELPGKDGPVEDRGIIRHIHSHAALGLGRRCHDGGGHTRLEAAVRFAGGCQTTRVFSTLRRKVERLTEIRWHLSHGRIGRPCRRRLVLDSASGGVGFGGVGRCERRRRRQRPAHTRRKDRWRPGALLDLPKTRPPRCRSYMCQKQIGTPRCRGLMQRRQWGSV